MSPVVPVSNGVAAHLVILINRDITVLDRTPNLGAAGRRTRFELEAVAHRLEQLIKRAQTVHLLAVMADNEGGNLRLADAASMAMSSVVTLRRRVSEGVLPRIMEGNKLVIPARALLRWVEQGKPNARQG